MRALVVAPRFPWPSTTGDRLRAAEWIAALFCAGDVTLVAPPGPPALVPLGVRHVVDEAECAPFERRAEVIPVGVELLPLDDAARDIDCSFWGRLGFFANRDAAELLLRDVWPAVRSSLLAARLLLAGADAPASLLAAHGRDGIEVLSPMEDRARLLRRVRVAVLPVRFGTGQSVKLLEACEAGLAVAALPAALRGVSFPSSAAVVCESPGELAGAVVRLLRDPARAEELAAAGRAWVERGYDREKTRARMRELVERVIATRRTVS